MFVEKRTWQRTRVLYLNDSSLDISFLSFFNPHPSACFHWFWEREREREKHWYEREPNWLNPHMPLPGTEPIILVFGMWPNQDSNQQPFSVQNDTPTDGATRPRPWAFLESFIRLAGARCVSKTKKQLGYSIHGKRMPFPSRFSCAPEGQVWRPSCGCTCRVGDKAEVTVMNKHLHAMHRNLLVGE